MRDRNTSSKARHNSNKLVSLLIQRLQSKGKAKSNDVAGNIIYIDCDIYATEMLEAFIDLSVSEFNATPYDNSP